MSYLSAFQKDTTITPDVTAPEAGAMSMGLSHAAAAAKRRQRGITIIEVMIALAVMLTVYGLVTGKIQMIFGRSDLTTEDSNIVTMLTNLRDLKTTSGYGASGTDLTSTMISRGYVPQNMTVTGGTIYNTWGGTVTFTSLGMTAQMAETAVPQSQCNALATKTSTGSNTGGQFASIQVNSATAVTGEYTAAQAATDCSDATNNTMTWATSN